MPKQIKDKDISGYEASHHLQRGSNGGNDSNASSYKDIVPPEVVGFNRHQRNRKRSQSYVKFLKYQRQSNEGKRGSQDGSVTSEGSEHSERYYQIIQKSNYNESRIDELCKLQKGGLQPSRFTSPTPLGLCAFSMSCFILSMYLTGAIIPLRHSSNGVVYGVAFWYGGLIEMLVGFIELYLGNAYAGLVFASFGGFWFSFSSLFVEAFGFLDNAGVSTYDDAKGMVIDDALGIYVLGWAFFSLMMTVGAIRTNIILFCILFFVFGIFIMLCFCYFLQNIYFQRAAGISGIIAATFGFYGAMAGLTTKDNNFFTLPVFPLDPIWKSFGLLGSNREPLSIQRVEAINVSDKV